MSHISMRLSLTRRRHGYVLSPYTCLSSHWLRRSVLCARRNRPFLAQGLFFPKDHFLLKHSADITLPSLALSTRSCS
jgi:hypothetical protein